MPFRIFSLFGLLLTTACATITQSPSQNISVVTEPPGATCELRRNGAVLAVANPTPGTLRIGRSFRALDVSCTRDGHQPAQTSVDPSVSPVFLGNILIGGVVGLVVDASTSASYYYPDTISLTLTPNAPPAVAPVPPTMFMEPIPDAPPVRRRSGGRPMS